MLVHTIWETFYLCYFSLIILDAYVCSSLKSKIKNKVCNVWDAETFSLHSIRLALNLGADFDTLRG